jgi:anthraniloyl-CoA monooxygenase
VKIVCVGAGPAGLYFAICAKLRDPGHEVTVVERGSEGVTNGWGFGFWDDVLDSLYTCDPVTAGEIEAASGVWDGIEVHVGSGEHGEPGYLGGYGLSMGRQRLLDILVARAKGLDVDLRFEHEVRDLAEVDRADLIVACDGINSSLRDARREQFGTRVDSGRNHYLWLGSHYVFHAFRYIFERTEAGWIWMHAYYLDDERSTCIVECPPETWVGLGFDDLGADETLRRLEKIFARHLEGHRLISQTRHGDMLPWLHGKQVSNERWYCTSQDGGHLVLMGDAAHSTHFSIGSGTRLALGDSVALAAALHEHPDVPSALAAYDAERRPAMAEAQRQAGNSMHWLERVPALLSAQPTPAATDVAQAVTQRLGAPRARWRHYLFVATQVGALRAVRSRLTAARRARRVRVRRLRARAEL